MKASVRIMLICCFAAIFVAAACSRSNFEARVQQAEALMDSAPDSALAIAESLRPDSRAERARAALLLTKARYKAYVPLTDDSLIALAADFYAGHNDSLETQALFFLGETYYEQKDHSKALLAALKAAHKSTLVKEWFYAGLSHRLLAQIYAENFSYSNEHNHRVKASNYFKKASKREHALWEDLDVAFSVASRGDNAAARNKLYALSSDTINMPADFKARLHRYNAVVSVLCKDYESVIDQMQKSYLYSRKHTSHDFSTIARAYIQMGELDKAKTYLDSAMFTISSFSDQGNAYMAMSELANMKGDNKLAHRYATLYLKLIEPKMDSIIASPMECLAIDYYNAELQKSIEIRRKNIVILSLAIIVCMAIAIILCWLLARNRANNRFQQERIQNLINELDFLKRKTETDSISSENRNFYNSLTTSLSNLELIATQFYKDSNLTNNKESTTKIKKVIDSFSSEPMISQLEEVINNKYTGIIDEIKEYYPKMSDKQKLLLY